MAEVRTDQQRRAEFAIKEIEALMNNSKKIDKDTATFIVGMPNMILSNGIGQTFAFLLSKEGKQSAQGKQGKVFYIMKKWIGQEKKDLNINSNIDFLKKFNSLPQKEYLEVQRECLRLVEWLKRYARAFQDND